MDYSLLAEIAMVLAGGIGVYAVLRYRVTSLENKVEKHIEDDNKLHKSEQELHADHHKEFDIKHNAVFKRYDSLLERIIILERDTSTHLDMPKAEEKFVTHKELQLQLQNLVTTITHTDKTVSEMSGKLDSLTQILQTNIVRTLSLGANREDTRQ